MNRVRRHQGFFLVLLACGVLIIAMSVWLGHALRVDKRARQRLQMLRKDARELTAASPSLTAQNEHAMESERRVLQRAWQQARARFPDSADSSTAAKNAVPSERADAYFDIAQFVERMRALLAEHQIKTAADERFGFAEYAHGGPDLDDLKWVYRERCAAEKLLRLLVDCRPVELVDVKREQLNRPGETKTGADGFGWESSRALRTPDVLESVALRVIFTGQTVSLRALLNELALPERLAVVRSVEVEPTSADSDKRSEAEHAADERSPLVVNSLSRFTVTVEFVEVIPNDAGDIQG